MLELEPIEYERSDSLDGFSVYRGGFNTLIANGIAMLAEYEDVHILTSDLNRQFSIDDPHWVHSQ